MINESGSQSHAHANALARIASEIRRLILQSIHHAGSGHAGPSLSLVEILTALYFAHLHVDPARPDLPDRDRLVLSKGHAAPALYAVLARAGFFPAALLNSLRALRSPLQGHPKAGLLPGVDVSTGSLGQGLSLALGIALGLRLRRCPAQVLCILGDGEMQEGQNWEAMMAGAAHGTSNLTAIVDRNGLQNDGPTEEIVPLNDLVAKARAFGWFVQAIDGHDLTQILAALAESRASTQPALIVANTVKGKGVSFMENQVKWHHHPLSESEYRLALRELT